MSDKAKGTARVLIVDDVREEAELAQMLLQRQGLSVEVIISAKAALDLVAAEDFDLVLTDVNMDEMSGIELCERLLGTRPDLIVIVMTGNASMDVAVSAMRNGAFDFLVKPFDPKMLGLSVARALKHRGLQEEVKRLRTEVAPSRGGLVGDSPAMRKVYDLVERVGPTDPSVLIAGESGTGKELVARAIHAASPRRNGPFVAINCAAVPPTLIESELFGHARGAFTDAKTSRDGLFVQANSGTLFLDEIGEMPLDMQAKLLRAIQERKVRPVGGNAEIPFDARILAATNRDLEAEVFEKRFREDLFYRINVVSIALPPLRERGGDVLLLAQAFLDRFSRKLSRPDLRMSRAVAEKLVAYHWPGNVRELENCVERMASLARFEELTIEDLPERIRAYRSDRFILAADHAEEILTIEELERRYIQRVLKIVEGNKSRAAELLGLDRRTLYRKLDRWEAEIASGKASARPL
ncbi:MAG: sigma-54 dependent transcriptional regulator [Polyangia bacterium]